MTMICDSASMIVKCDICDSASMEEVTVMCTIVMCMSMMYLTVMLKEVLIVILMIKLCGLVNTSLSGMFVAIL